MADLISVIVATYNREDALDAVLRGLGAQTDQGFEIVVADDGSGPATRELVAAWKARLGVPVTHVWQEDRGFRLAEIRNRAIVASRGSYCIFLDGDCIPRPHFITYHRRLAEPGWFVAGNRVFLSHELTEHILGGRLEAERWGLGRWTVERLRSNINRLTPLCTLPLGPLRKLRADAWRGTPCCNLAVWRSDLGRIDGFDASFKGWGFEDSDLVIRLMHTGVRRRDGNFYVGVLHLWHPGADRSHLPETVKRIEDLERSTRVRALVGLSALEGSGEPDASRSGAQ